MDWYDLAEMQRDVARHLFAANDRTFDRAVCGRAYYAAYALVTWRLPKQMRFEHGWHNPAHARLPGCVANIAGLEEGQRRAVRRGLRRLRQRREDADYRPTVTVDGAAARESMRDVREVLDILNSRSMS